MTEEPTSIAPDAPALTLREMIGPVADRLLADKVLLLFDFETGSLCATNHTAQMQLGLDDSNPIQPTFAEMAGADQAATHWDTLVAGQDCAWSGVIDGALGLSMSGMINATPCGTGDLPTHTLVQVTEAATDAASGEGAEASPVFASMDASVGTITFDLDGNILTLNDRAMTAMEDYGEELVGQNHDKIWPKAVCESEEYFDFWEKLRQGRTVEGRYKHLTAVGTEVWFHCIFAPIQDSSGQSTKILQCLMDVSESTYAAEKAIEQSDALWDGLAMCTFDKDRHIMAINQKMADILGQDVDEAIGQHDEDFCDKGFARGTLYKKTWEDLAAGKTQTLRIRHRNSEQELVWLAATMIPVMDETGQLEKVIKVGDDITEEHEDHIDSRAMLAASEDMVGRAEFDGTGALLKGNKTFRKLFKVEENGLISRSLKDLFSPRMASDTRYRNFWDRMHEGTRINKTDEMQTLDGETVYIKATYVPLFTPNGNFWKLALFFVDVTASKIRELKLEERMRAINLTQMMVEYAPDGTVLDVNDRFISTFGFSEAEVRGQKVSTLYAHDSKESESHRKMWERINSGESETGEFRHRNQNDEDVWLFGAYSPIMDAKQNVVSIILFASEITEEKLSNLEIRSKLGALNALQSVVEYDTAGNVLSANDKFLQTFGYSLREIVGQHHSMFCSPDYVQTDDYRTLWFNLGKGEGYTGRVRRIARFNRDVHLSASYHPVRNIDGEVTKIIKSAVEISAQIALETKAQESSQEIIAMIENGTGSGIQIKREAEDLSITTKSSQSLTEENKTKVEKTLQNLSSASGEISELAEIVEVVGEIAVQTNLLAFNAAIEAARAGEHGIGFSIVADEVRKLAERNGEAARGISRHVEHASGLLTAGTTNAGAILDDLGAQAATLAQSADSITAIIKESDVQSDKMAEVIEVTKKLSATIEV
ncbi:MAG: PAS domain-containing methyl-accepting chemotaxis protein [Pseudomonadota bacterium]